jgi:hypothetical protein
MKRRNNEVNTRARFKKIFFFVAAMCALIATVSSCDGQERHADRLWRQAMERVEKGDTQGAVDRLQKIIDEYPDTRIAAKAREQVIVYRGLVTAVESYPMRRARELMVQVARAIESYRKENGHAPATLAELVPGKLTGIPNDPWGRPFTYEISGRSYRLKCQDGSPTDGSSEAKQLLVVDGEFRVVTP